MGSAEEKLEVLVVGAGGVGTMACVAMERSGRATVTAVLRSNFKRVKEYGFEIDSIDHGKLSAWRPTSIVPSVPTADSAHPFDYIIVTMKNIPEVVNIPEVIRPAVTSGKSTIVLIQNGFGIEQPMVDAFPSNVVLSATSFIGAHERNGSVSHVDHDAFQLGAFHNPNLDPEFEKAKRDEFAAVYGTTTPDVILVDDIVYYRWRKLIWNGTFNPLCAITQLDSAGIRRYGGEYSLIRPAMAEMAAIARADGHALSDDIADAMIDTTSIDLGFKPSMLVDVEKGNPMEIEVILGNPLRIARKLGVQTPVLDNTYRMLKLIQARLMEARGLIKPPTDIPKHDVFEA